MPPSPRQQVAKIIGDLGHKADILLGVIVLETDKKLKEQSPVDEGTFRASWRISETEIDESVNKEGDTTTQNYSNKIEIGNNYYLTNSLPYAQRLAEGWSQQAPSGWVELIAAGIPPRAEQIAEDLKRGS